MGLYLPEQSGPFMTLYGNSPSILTLLLADTCERARVGAARFLEVLWENVPVAEYLRHPHSCNISTYSFASMPKRISLMLYQVHATLVYSMQHEKDLVTTTQILKVKLIWSSCLLLNVSAQTATSVMQICPYSSICTILRNCELEASFTDVFTAYICAVYSIIGSAYGMSFSIMTQKLMCYDRSHRETRRFFVFGSCAEYPVLRCHSHLAYNEIKDYASHNNSQSSNRMGVVFVICIQQIAGGRYIVYRSTLRQFWSTDISSRGHDFITKDCPKLFASAEVCHEAIRLAKCLFECAVAITGRHWWNSYSLHSKMWIPIFVYKRSRYSRLI